MTSSKSTLKEVLEDERAVAIIEEYVPGFTENPELGPVAGMKMKALMDGLRTNPPASIAGLAVESVVDYATGVSGLPAANVVEFDLEGANKLIVRPSGTEPKVKAYLFAKGETREAAEALLANLEATANEIMA